MKTKKYITGLVIVAVAVLMILSLAGCSSSMTTTVAPTSTSTPPTTIQPTTTAPTTTTQPTTTAPVTATKLTFAAFQSDKSYWVPAVAEWVKDFESQTGGRYKVEFNYGGGMGASADYYNMLTSGVYDLTAWQPTMNAGRFPVSELITLPIAAPTVSTMSQAFRELQLKGYLDKEYTGAKVLFVWAASGQIIVNNKVAVKTLTDMKGLRVGNSGGYAVDVIKAMGAVPVDMPVSERYMSIDKKILDGTLGTYSAINTYKLYEVVKYSTEPGLCSFPFAMVLNKATYDKFPADVKAIVDAMAKNDKYTKLAGQLGDADIKKGVDIFIANGGTVSQWDPVEFAKIGTNLIPLWEKTIADSEAKGVPAKQVVSDLYKIMQGLGVKDPFAGFIPAN